MYQLKSRVCFIRYFPVREIYIQTSGYHLHHLRYFLLVISTRMIFSVIKTQITGDVALYKNGAFNGIPSYFFSKIFQPYKKIHYDI